ncbi:MAG: penicillin-binding protein 2 [Flavobacteriales bacterium TMED96]|nr:MAG: penicillin-binding protein 2 [Flavobacteriales bacterium TMED96]
MIRIYLLNVLTIVIGLIFFVKLFGMQVLNKDYDKLSQNNAIIEIEDYPERGFIYDRKGRILVSNQPAYDIMTVPENLSTFDTLSFCMITGIDKKELIINLESARKFSMRLPSVVVNQISKETYAKLQEQMWKFQGFFIQKKSIRDYRVNFGANVLGYVSEVNSEDLIRDKYYRQGDLIGRQGIEKSYEKELRGKKGKKFLQKDRFNRIIGPYKNGDYDVKPSQAKNINLTIDIELQSYGEKLMINKRGGVVAIEPETGEVLALISAPSYDPNILVGRQRSNNYKTLANDTISKPLFDRALLAQYSPGSTLKPLNALIALQEKVIDKETKYECNKGFYYAKNAHMDCNCIYGTKNNLIGSIQKSCNTFFSKTYINLINNSTSSANGVENWKKYLESFGLGSFLGYDLPIGRPGLIPNSEFYNNLYIGENWSATNIISNGIGQGEVLATPIQLANYASAIANKGYYITPHFVKAIDGENTKTKLAKIRTAINSNYFNIIIDGMHKVIEEGSARIAKIKGLNVCGKTGTVENYTTIQGKKTQLTDHSIFIAFAPKENPKIAIATFIENGYWGSRWAAPISSLMIEKYLNNSITRPRLEKRMLNGSLENEYKKPLSGVNFKVNE